MSVSGSTTIGGCGFEQGKEGDTFKPYDYTSKPADGKGSATDYVPSNISGHYSSHDKEGVLRPTVTEGEIIVRSNPDAETDGSLDGLNRDIGKAREITKDEEAYTDIYVSKQAIEAIIDSAKELIKLANTPTPEEVQKQREQVVQDYKDADGNDADVFAKLIYSGIDPALAKQMMTYPQVATIVREQTEINKAIDPNNFTAEDLNKPLQNSSFGDKTLGQALFFSMYQIGLFVNNVKRQDEALAEAVQNAFQLAAGGPIKFALGIAFNAALDYVNTLSGNALGAGAAELVDNVLTKLWFGCYKEEFLQRVEDGLYPNHTQADALAMLDRERSATATGISIVIGIGGGLIKVAKGSIVKVKPKDYENALKQAKQYDAARPTYEINPEHAGSLKSGKTPLPSNAENVFKNSVPYTEGGKTVWYGYDPSEKAFYRYADNNLGQYHFNGSTQTGLTVPPSIKKMFGVTKGVR